MSDEPAIVDGIWTRDTPPTAADLEPGQFVVTAKPRRTTLGEHGSVLIGGSDPGGFELAPLDVAYRRIIGQEVNSRRQFERKFGLRALHYLAHSIIRWGDIDISAITTPEARIVHFAGMTIQDMQYIGFLRQHDEHDGMLPVDLDGQNCPHCGADLPERVRADLDQIVVEVFDEKPRAWRRLVKPWRWRNQQVEVVTLEPPSIERTMRTMRDDHFAEPELQKLWFTAAAISEVDGMSARIAPNDLSTRDPATGRSFSGIDIDGCYRAVDQLGGGAASQIPWCCPHCGAEIFLPVGWEPGFFS